MHARMTLPGASPESHTSDMAVVPPKSEATYADIEGLPENVVGEIIDGELVVSPRPAPRHARAATRLITVLGPPFDVGRGGPGGWVFLVEPELHLRNDVLVPDLAAWRRERMPEVPDPVGITVAPDWLCEVLSPSTSMRDRTKKMRIYKREGVRHLWLLDPTDRTLEAYALDGKSWRHIDTFAEDERVRVEPFEAIELELGLLWAR
jgi:Uma2 family endonuclease